MDNSAIINLEAVASDDSDYEMDFSTDPLSDRKGQQDKFGSSEDIPHQSDGTNTGDLKGELSKGVASYVWQEGQQRARKAFSLYANIDILRPYYDIEPREVRNRLLRSLIPKMQGAPMKIPRELYGPTMMVLTLIALLLFQMKSYKVTVQEGTLMGSAFVTCFGYWFGITGFLWLAAFVCNTRVAVIQLLNLLGYALFGHCIVVLLTVVIHPNHSHLFFYLIWLIFGGLSSLRMASVLMSRTNGKSQKLIISGIIIFIHLFFLFYLHFAYHHVVEDLSEAFGAAHTPPRPVDVHPGEGFVKDVPVQVDTIEKVPEGVNAVTEAALHAVTKFAKRALRKGLFGATEKGDVVKLAVNKVLQR